MDNKDIAEAFRRYAIVGGECYRTMAKVIKEMEDYDLTLMAKTGRLQEIYGIGPKYASLIEQIIEGVPVESLMQNEVKGYYKSLIPSNPAKGRLTEKIRKVSEEDDN